MTHKDWKIGLAAGLVVILAVVVKFALDPRLGVKARFASTQVAESLDQSASQPDFSSSEQADQVPEDIYPQDIYVEQEDFASAEPADFEQTINSQEQVWAGFEQPSDFALQDDYEQQLQQQDDYSQQYPGDFLQPSQDELVSQQDVFIQQENFAFSQQDELQQQSLEIQEPEQQDLTAEEIPSQETPSQDLQDNQLAVDQQETQPAIPDQQEEQQDFAQQEDEQYFAQQIASENPADGPDLTVYETEPIKTEKFHIVQKNQSLWTIAGMYYDSGSEWTKIHEANLDVIEDPNKLDVGMKLIIPD